MNKDSSFAGQPATSDTTDEGGLHATPLPPGWDEGVRLDEDPATIPDPASV